jgi:hypothetical protein
MEGFVKGLEYVLNIIGFYKYIQPVMSGFIVTLGTIYVASNLLGILRTSRQKNITAVIIICIYSVLAILNKIPEFINDVCITIGWISIIYTLFGIRLFDHISKLQDTKFGEITYIDTETGQEKVFKRKQTVKRKLKK